MAALSRFVTVSSLVAIGGCASAPPTAPDTRPIEQIVAQATDRKIEGPNIGLMFWSAVAPLQATCQRDGGTLDTVGHVDTVFIDRLGKSRLAATASLPSKMTCRQRSGDFWGVALRVDSPTYSDNYVAPRIFQGTFVAKLISADDLMAEKVGLAAEQTRARIAREARERECRARREAYINHIRSKPTPGMKVALGMIVEVRGAIALVQYDREGRMLYSKEQEWVPVARLETVETCPLLP